MKLRTVLLSALAVGGLVATAACAGATAPRNARAASAPQGGSVQQVGPVQQVDAAQQPGGAPQVGVVPQTAQAADATGAPAGEQNAFTNRTITATGSGTVSGTPDTLTVQLGVQTRAATASAALNQNNTAAASLIAKLKSSGVAEKDLRTSSLSVYATYSDNGSTVTGYEVSNMVTATLHDVSKAGALIDAAQSAAGNGIRVDGISFSFADDSSLRAKARADAVKQALTQAKQLADAAGVTVGQVMSISESGGSAPMPMYAMPSAAGAADSAATPVLPGSADLTVTVQVVVAIG